MTFDWDPLKAAENLDKHGISFDQARQVFYDPNARFYQDVDHSDAERREKAVGFVETAGIVLVVFTERRQDVIRIISARAATKRERQDYEENEATD